MTDMMETFHIVDLHADSEQSLSIQSEKLRAARAVYRADPGNRNDEGEALLATYGSAQGISLNDHAGNP